MGTPATAAIPGEMPHAALPLWMFLPPMLLLLGGCVSHPVAPTRMQSPEAEIADSPVVDTQTLLDIPTLVSRIADRRVIYVGETHDRYAHHLVQLEIIRRLHARGRPLAVAMEFFQQPYQEALDQWVAGAIGEAEMLRRTEYFTRWRFDYRLYRPILRFARDHGIPLVALNVPREVTQAVSRKGFAGLEAAQRRWLPEHMDTSDTRYRERLEEVFSRHPPKTRERAFQHFYEAQLLWDEGMAQRLAAYLKAHPERQVIVLTGAGHVAFRRGIPNRLQRRIRVPDAVVLLGAEALVAPEVGDYVVAPTPRELPPRGLLGIFMKDTPKGVVVEDFSPKSAAQVAGLRKGDRILTVDGRTVRDSIDLRLALLDARPGQQVELEVERGRGAHTERRRYTLTLGAPPRAEHR